MRRLMAAVVLIALALSLVPTPVRGQAAGPEIYDLNGMQRDLAWLHARYGNMRFDYATAPKFSLARIDATVGPPTIVVQVFNAQGGPAYNQPVALSWPGIDCSVADPNIKPLDPAYRTRLMGCAIVQRTNQYGQTGFGMSTDWYYRNGEAPGIVWVLSPSIASDGARSVGMLGGTNHEGPLHLTFQEVALSPPTPTPRPPTVTPGPVITPVPGGTGDLAETNALLARIVAAIEDLVGIVRAFARHLGVPALGLVRGAAWAS